MKYLIISHKNFLALVLMSLILLSSNVNSQTAGDNSLKKLLDGNARYLSGNLKEKKYSEERKEQANGQKPYAIIVTCSDSRVPPEIIFDEDLGEIFVIRVAGNVVDKVVLGSIEYAAEHLKAPLLVIMGHSKCGAVQASLAGGEVSENIGVIVEKIHHSAELAKKSTDDKSEQLKFAVKENVNEQLETSIKESKIIEEMEHEGTLKIVGGIYDIETGRFSLIKQ